MAYLPPGNISMGDEGRHCVYSFNFVTGKSSFRYLDSDHDEPIPEEINKRKVTLVEVDPEIAKIRQELIDKLPK